MHSLLVSNLYANCHPTNKTSTSVIQEVNDKKFVTNKQCNFEIDRLIDNLWQDFLWKEDEELKEKPRIHPGILNALVNNLRKFGEYDSRFFEDFLIELKQTQNFETQPLLCSV
ncbi:hypothetical protein P618_200486 [Holospora obtusa F1]|uniref:Uncharacterized protein n=2 Tax=Holospora obtusa TaxID=49893 RepID=W6THE7_HOLOB|nr:hypothetical protein P618_200486 [Holospora obtusa F1]